MNKLVVFLVAVLAMTGAFLATHAVNAQIQSGGPGAAPFSAAPENAGSGAVIQAYYRALSSKNVSLATPFLSDSVVLQVSQPYGNGTLEYAGIKAVQHYLEGDMRRINSLTIQEMSVNGDRVEYTVAEWLDPRSVGPLGPFPSVNRYAATVRDGKIQSITQRPLD